jgi:hypothetical protein
MATLFILSAINCVNARYLGGSIGVDTHQIEDSDTAQTTFRPCFTCYIEASGKVAEDDYGRVKMWKTLWLRPFSDNRAFVTFWHINFQPDANITIYSRENGRVLWQHEGNQTLNMLGFFGNYIPSSSDDRSFQVTMNGVAYFAMPRLMD